MRRALFKRFVSAIVAVAICIGGLGLTAKNVFAYNAGIEAFVNSLYADCLGRNADPTGFNDWCNKLATGQITGKQAAYGFFFSPEFQAKANAWSDDQLIEAYYRVFLNRGSDPNGLSYWRGKIANTTNDVSILFTGFADSAEFASKCASYGITVGAHVEVPTTTRGSTTSVSGGSVNGVYNGGYNATSAQALDDYWTSRGYEIFYIDLGNGATQKCYVKFNDMTEHNNQVNAWRNQNGLPSLAVISDPNDARYQFARRRAVEVAYFFSHVLPMELPYRQNGIFLSDAERGIPAGETGENIFGGDAYTGLCENGVIGGFEAFRTSPIHNGAMLDDWAHSMVTASCSSVLFVASDGISVSSASPSTGYGTSTVQLFYS